MECRVQVQVKKRSTFNMASIACSLRSNPALTILSTISSFVDPLIWSPRAILINNSSLIDVKKALPVIGKNGVRWDICNARARNMAASERSRVRYRWLECDAIGTTRLPVSLYLYSCVNDRYISTTHSLAHHSIIQLLYNCLYLNCGNYVHRPP